jgi:hypothetical protein
LGWKSSFELIHGQKTHNKELPFPYFSKENISSCMPLPMKSFGCKMVKIGKEHSKERLKRKGDIYIYIYIYIYTTTRTRQHKSKVTKSDSLPEPTT